MFNGGGFNTMPFNTPHSINIYGAFELDSELDTLITAGLVIQGSFDLSSELDTVFDGIRDRLAQFIIDNTLDMEFEATRFRYGNFNIEGKLDVQFNASRYHVDVLEFTGEFKPGDRIEIDSKWLTFNKNGQNVLEGMKGDFFDLNLGNNLITYTDDQSGRTVRMRITHGDKFV